MIHKLYVDRTPITLLTFQNSHWVPRGRYIGTYADKGDFISIPDSDRVYEVVDVDKIKGVLDIREVGRG